MLGKGLLPVSENPLLAKCGIPPSGDLSSLSLEELREIIRALSEQIVKFKELEMGAAQLGQVMAEKLGFKSLVLREDTHYLIWFQQVAATLIIIEEKRKAAKQLQEERDALKAEVSRLKALVESYIKKNLGELSKVKELEAKLALLEPKAKALTEENSRLESKLEDATRAKLQAKQGQAHAMADNKALKTQIRELEAQIKDERAAQQKQLSGLMPQIKELKERLGLLSTLHSSQHADRLKELQSLACDLTHRFNTRISELQATIADLRADNVSLGKANTVMRAELDKLKPQSNQTVPSPASAAPSPAPMLYSTAIAYWPHAMPTLPMPGPVVYYVPGPMPQVYAPGALPAYPGH